MDNKSKIRSKRNKAKDALLLISGKYNIELDKVEMLAPVYYPIATIEMDLEEMSFEDFELVQLMVLKLFALGQKDYRIIAELMGLSPSYIIKQLKLLYGYGYISDNELTEIGNQSLIQEKKIIIKRAKQKFQLDSINSNLVKIDKTVSQGEILSKQETKGSVAHMNYLDKVSSSVIETQLRQEGYSGFIRKRNGILNINVKEIQDIKCLEVNYAEAYLVKHRDFSEPIIFIYRYDYTKANVKDRFSWQPISIPTEDIRKRLGVEEVAISGDLAIEYTMNTYKLILDRLQSMNNEFKSEIIKDDIKYAYSFLTEGVVHQGYNNNGQYVIEISSKVIGEYKKSLLYLLTGFYKYGQGIIVSEKLCTLIIIKTTDKRILDTARLLCDKIKVIGEKKFIDALDSSLLSKEFNHENIIDWIYDAAQSIKEENELV